MRETSSGEEGSPRDRGRRRPGRPALLVGLLLSFAVHAVLLVVVAFPSPRPARTDDGWAFRQVNLPPRIEVPDPPERVERPPPPSVARTDVEEPALAGGEPGLPAPAPPLPEPPDVQAVTPSEYGDAVPRDVPPMLQAPDRLRRRLRRSYRRMLSGPDGVDAAGVVWVRFFVDPGGEVSRVRVAGSSGSGSLDRLARELVEEMEFRPALNRDRTVGVWVTQPICFVPVGRGSGEAAEARCDRDLALGGG